MRSWKEKDTREKERGVSIRRGEGAGRDTQWICNEKGK